MLASPATSAPDVCHCLHQIVYEHVLGTAEKSSTRSRNSRDGETNGKPDSKPKESDVNPPAARPGWPDTEGKANDAGKPRKPGKGPSMTQKTEPAESGGGSVEL